MHVTAPLAAAALVALATSASAQLYSIGSNPQGSLGYSIAAAVAKVATEEAGMRVNVVPQGGPVVVLPLVNAGELQFSTSAAVVSALAHQGREMFAGKPQSDLRAVAPTVMLHVGIFARKGSGIRSLADLKGKRLATRHTTQRINDLFTQATLATVGLTYADIVEVPVPNGVRGVDDLIAGQVDGAAFSVGSGKTAEADAAVGGIRFLGAPHTPEAEAAMQKVAPGTMLIAVEPAAHIVGIDAPTPLLSSPFILNASTRTSDEVVYNVVKVIYEHKAKLVAALKAFEDFDPQTMAMDVGLPHHPGAVKFYREKGLMQ